MSAAMADGTPARRVILLGASNLARAFPTIVATARGTWGEPVEIMAAMGHGRSYGQDSTMLGRKISGIFPCALWQDLQNRPALPTAALVTDIGNDLLYGVGPEQLLEWVVRCLDRLAEANAKTVVTQTPIDNVDALSEARFRFFRRLFFPRNRMTLGEIRSLAREFNARLVGAGQQRNIPVIPVPAEWYGLDPIHLRRSVLRTAWPQLLSAWHDAPSPVAIGRPSLRTIVYLASRVPSERSYFGIRQRAAQPSGRLPDGTTISLY